MGHRAAAVVLVVAALVVAACGASDVEGDTGPPAPATSTPAATTGVDAPAY